MCVDDYSSTLGSAIGTPVHYFTAKWLELKYVRG
jgi:hypothetical protein